MKTLIRFSQFMVITVMVIGFLATTGTHSQAGDERRIIGGLIGTGIQIFLNESQRKKGESKFNKRKQQTSNTSRLTQNQTFQIQKALSKLGYNVGRPDGTYGSKTYKAVRHYQTNLGEPVTGYLTQSQISGLLNWLRRLPQTTKPQDFVRERKLNRTELVALQRSMNILRYNAGKADGKPGRKTGRAVSRFLRDRGYDPETTSPTDALRMATSEAGIKMPVSEIIGSNSPTNSPNEAPTFPTTNVNNNSVTPKELKTTNTRSRADFVNRNEYDAGKKYKDTGLKLELARRAIFNQPSLLDERKVLVDWFDEVYPRHFYGVNKKRMTALTRLFYGGTSFDRADALKQFRKQIEKEATNEPLRLTRSFRATISIGKFQSGRGFPMRVLLDQIHREINSSLSSDRLYVDHLGRPIQMYFDNTPDISLLPITDETEARKLSQLLKNDRYANLRLEVYVTVKQVGTEIIKESVGYDKLLTDASIDGIALVLLPTRLSKIKTPNVIFRWGKKDGESNRVAGLSSLEFAKWAGIPVVADHLAIFQNQRYDKYRNTVWRKYFDMVQLQGNPDLFDDDAAALFFGNMILSEREKSSVSRGKKMFGSRRFEFDYKTGANAYNEFDFPEVMQTFRQKFKKKIFSKQPIFPLPIVHITPTQLGKYDSKQQGFPLSYANINGSWKSQGPGGSRLASIVLKKTQKKWRSEAVETGVRELPKILKLPVDQARQLLAVLEKVGRRRNNRVSYIAVFSNVDKPSSGAVRSGRRKGQHVLLHEMKPYRIALFADKKLRQKIAEFEVSDGWRGGNGKTQPRLSKDVLTIDAETVALWRIKNNASLLENEKELRSSLEIRRRIEVYGKRYKSTIKPVLPRAILRKSEDPQTPDLIKFRNFIAGTAQSANFSMLRFPYGLMGSRSNEGVLSIRLDKTVGSGWTENPVFKKTRKNKQAKQVAQSQFPRSAGIFQISTATSHTAFLVFRDNPAWFGLSFKTKTRTQAGGRFAGSVFFKVHQVKHIKDKTAGEIVIFEVEPTKVTHTDDSGNRYEVAIPLMAAAKVADVPRSKMEILGVHIGMSLGEAIKSLEKNGFDTRWKRQISSSENALGSGLLFVGQERRSPQLMLFTKGGGSDDTIIGILRYEPKHDGKPAQVITSLEDKFGPADGKYKYHRGGYYYAWGDIISTKKLIQAEGTGHDCVLYPLRNTNLWDGNSAYVNSYELKKTCGTVLSTYVDDNTYLLLIDTNSVIAERKRLRDEKKSGKQKKTKSKTAPNTAKLNSSDAEVIHRKKASDILGLTVGMNVKEALGVLPQFMSGDFSTHYVDAREHMKGYLARDFNKSCTPVEAGTLDAVVVTAGYQVIALHFDAQDDQREIHTITRVLDLDQVGISNEDVLTALKEKYGKIKLSNGTYFGVNLSPTYSWGACLRGKDLLHAPGSRYSGSGGLSPSPQSVLRSRQTRECKAQLQQQMPNSDPRQGLYFLPSKSAGGDHKKILAAKYVSRDAALNPKTGLPRKDLLSLILPTGGISSPTRCGRTVYAKFFVDTRGLKPKKKVMVVVTDVKKLLDNAQFNLKSIKAGKHKKKGKVKIRF